MPFVAVYVDSIEFFAFKWFMMSLLPIKLGTANTANVPNLEQFMDITKTVL